MPSDNSSGSGVVAMRSSAAHRAIPGSTPTPVSVSQKMPATKPDGRSAGPGASVVSVAATLSTVLPAVLSPVGVPLSPVPAAGTELLTGTAAAVVVGAAVVGGGIVAG